MKNVAARVLFIIMGIVILWLAWEGNLGRGLACILTPGSLEVDV